MLVFILQRFDFYMFRLFSILLRGKETVIYWKIIKMNWKVFR